MLALSQVQILEFLARQYEVREDRRGALKGRLQHFQRLGFPAGLNTGRGRAATYDLSKTLQLLIAFEMLQMALSGEQVVRILKGSELALSKAAFAVGQMLGEKLGIAEPDHRRFSISEDSFLITFDPHALADFSNSEAQRTDWGEAFLFDDEYLSWKTRHCIINTTLLISQALPHLSAVSSVAEGEIVEELIELAAIDLGKSAHTND